jgi:hypothetical protein
MKSEQTGIYVSLQYQAKHDIDGDDTFILSVDGTIYGEAVDEKCLESKIELGELKLFVIKVGNAISAGASLPVILDTYQQTLDAGCVLFNDSFDDYSPGVKDKFEDAYASDDILLLDRLNLNPLVRGQRLGLAALWRGMQDWSAGCSLVAIKPFPVQFEGGGCNTENVSKLQLEGFKGSKIDSFRRLRNYYEKLGFERIARSDIYALCTHGTAPSWKSLSIPDRFYVPTELLERPEAVPNRT